MPKKIIFITILIALLTSLIVGQYMGTSKAEKKKDVLKNVLDRGEIRVGYVINPPSLIKDPNTGKLSGIYYDAVEKMGDSMSLKINWAEEVGWGAMIQGLESHRYDMVVGGIWPSSTRGKRVNFSIPLYFSAVCVYTKPGEKRFSDLNRINQKDITIAVVDGDTSSIIAKTFFPNAQLVSLTQDTPLSHLLLNIKTGKADVTFIEKIIAEEFLKHNPGSVQNITPKVPLKLFGNTILIAKNQSAFEGLINTALGELINSNIADDLVKKYQKYPNALYPPIKPFNLESRNADHSL